MENCVSLWNKIPSCLNQFQTEIRQFVKTGYCPDSALKVCKSMQAIYNLVSSYDTHQCDSPLLHAELRSRDIDDGGLELKKIAEEHRDVLMHLFASCLAPEEKMPSSFPDTASMFQAQAHKA